MNAPNLGPESAETLEAVLEAFAELTAQAASTGVARAVGDGGRAEAPRVAPGLAGRIASALEPRIEALVARLS